jgi:singapore isolate B (sub-type 7) whole genome shotgun sequence assembly, scaffold_7
MVLAELGKGLTTALAKLQTTTVIDDDVVNEIIKEVSNALLHVRECSGSVNDSPM